MVARTELLRIDALGHVFTRPGGSVSALDGITFGVAEAEFLSIVGPSGCGKSTLLNMVAGLRRPTYGQVLFRGQQVVGPTTQIGYITQKDTLLPWRSAIANVALPLELHGVGRNERCQRARQLLAQMGLAGFESHHPHELSGGMRQRARIARTFIYNPEVILMDEPFGPLDAQTRRLLQNHLMEFWEAHRKTVIFVTHDLEEAIALADRVMVMTARPGRIKAMFEVPLPRPRNAFAVHRVPGFTELYDRVGSELQEEVVIAAATETT